MKPQVPGGYGSSAKLTGKAVSAPVLGRAAVQPSDAEYPLLWLQRQYGNRYVQQVIAQGKRPDDKGEATLDLERTIERARGGGQALDSEVRAQMEPAFDTDFSGVRVHADAQADTLNQALNARAFTIGQDIFFRQGEHSPGTSSGRGLLAHELTHAIQQSKSGTTLSRQTATPISGSTSLKQLLSDLISVSASDVSPSNFCKPFPSKARAHSWHRIMRAIFIPLITSGAGSIVGDAMSLARVLGLSIPPQISALSRVAQRGFGSEVGSLWLRYLTGPKKQNRVTFSSPSSEIVQGFVNSDVTRERQSQLIEVIKRRLPRLCRRVRRLRRLRSNRWTDIEVSRLLPRRVLRHPIDYNIFTEIPGNIAGGVSESDYGWDSREVRGKGSFYRETDASGRTTGIRLKTDFQFIVSDAVDFCPGGAGASIEKVLTVPLSRLEMSGLANDVPFRVQYRGKPVEEALASSLVRRCRRRRRVRRQAS